MLFKKEWLYRSILLIVIGALFIGLEDDRNQPIITREIGNIPLEMEHIPLRQNLRLQEKYNKLPKKEIHLVEEMFATSEAIQMERILADMEQYPSVKVIATGYTAGPESTGKTADHPEYGITYSGVEVKRDLYSTIAADLSIYPLGTIFYIPDYGYGVVTDKGGAIKGNKIDLFFNTVEDVYAEWGKKELEIYLIKEGNGEITEEEMNSLNERESLTVFRKQIQNNLH